MALVKEGVTETTTTTWREEDSQQKEVTKMVPLMTLSEYFEKRPEVQQKYENDIKSWVEQTGEHEDSFPLTQDDYNNSPPRSNNNNEIHNNH